MVVVGCNGRVGRTMHHVDSDARGTSVRSRAEGAFPPFLPFIIGLCRMGNETFPTQGNKNSMKARKGAHVSSVRAVQYSTVQYCTVVP